MCNSGMLVCVHVNLTSFTVRLVATCIHTKVEVTRHMKKIESLQVCGHVY